METFSTLVKGTKTDQDKAAFSDCVIESIITMSRDIIPERVYQAFKNLKEAIQEQVEVDQKDLHIAKTQGTLQGNKIEIRKNSLPLQIFAPTKEIIQRLKARGLVTKKGKPRSFSAILQEDDRQIVI